MIVLAGDCSDRNVRRVGRAVGLARLVAFADVDHQLHVERRALVEVADQEVGVGDLDIKADASKSAESGRLFFGSAQGSAAPEKLSSAAN